MAVVSDIRAITYALYPRPFWFHSRLYSCLFTRVRGRGILGSSR